MEVLQDANAVEARIPLEEPTDAVQVITVHSAKGREFPVVFLPFLQSARFPLNYRPPDVVDTPPTDWHPWQLERPLEGKPAHLEEERRLFYVAVTRAKEQCIILTTPKRRSPFIRDLPDGLVTERELMEPEVQTPSGLPEQVTTELKQRLAQELSRSAWEQTHQLVDAIRLVQEFKQGLQPDLSAHPLGAQLRELLRLSETTDKSTPPRQSLSLSPSSIGSYETCPLQYRFSRIDHIPGKEDKPYFTFGRVIHAVLEAYHEPDGEHHGRPLLELLEEKWESEGFTFPQEEDQYRADARKLLTAYEQALAAPPPVLAVEHHFSFPLDDITLTGRIDRIDLDKAGRAALVDYKTSRRRMTEKEAAADPQLALYALYMRQAGEIEDRKVPAKVEDMDLIYYFLRSDEPQVVVHMDDATLDAFRQRVAEVADGIRRRQFPHRKGFHCGYCDYKDLICPAWEKESLA
jgi:DNA helicase-2/ATP-dependent DNA helicase PcrA